MEQCLSLIDISDKRELQIRDAMGDILEQLPLALTKEEDAFSKDLLPVSYTHLDVYKRQMLEHHKPAKDIYEDGSLFLDFSEQFASLNGKPLARCV